MEKAVQAMVQRKADALTADMKKNVAGAFGCDDAEQPEKAAQNRQNILQDMSLQKEKKKSEREKLHKKRSDEREKLRDTIRQKYDLKKTTSNSSTDPIAEQPQENARENGYTNELGRTSSPTIDSKNIFCCMS